eukprot:571358-Amorphochlora_amoeboformis.AAC.1
MAVTTRPFAKIPAGQSVALPFAENLNHLSKQSSNRDFVQAVLEAVHLSQTGKLAQSFGSSVSLTQWLLSILSGILILGEELDESDSTKDAPDGKYMDETAKAGNTPTLSTVSSGRRNVPVGARVRILSCKVPRIGPKSSEAIIIRTSNSTSRWFTAKLNDGRIIKIRRLAFELLGDGPKDASIYDKQPVDADQPIPPKKPSPIEVRDAKQLPQRPSLYRRNAPRDSKLKRKITLDIEPESPKRRKPQSKARGGKSNLVGKHVIIECGRYKGESGFVIRGGNGYYCVQLDGQNAASSRGNVMKRSSDLRAIPFPNDADSAGNKYKMARNSPRNADLSGASSAHCKNESWVNRKVYVKAGKHQGKIGVIRRSGHGFYCVNIPSVGDVMKRASDLQLCREKEVKPKRKPEDEGAALQKAAYILMDLMSQSMEEEEDIEGVVDEEESSEEEEYVEESYDIMPEAPHKKHFRLQGLPQTELNTPVLKSTLKEDFSWERPDTAAYGNLLPDPSNSHGALVSHSLSSYW